MFTITILFILCCLAFRLALDIWIDTIKAVKLIVSFCRGAMYFFRSVAYTEGNAPSVNLNEFTLKGE